MALESNEGKIMSENPRDEQQLAADQEKKRHDEHDEALVEEWEDESFPASDPPSNY